MDVNPKYERSFRTPPTTRRFTAVAPGNEQWTAAKAGFGALVCTVGIHWNGACPPTWVGRKTASLDVRSDPVGSWMLWRYAGVSYRRYAPEMHAAGRRVFGTFCSGPVGRNGRSRRAYRKRASAGPGVSHRFLLDAAATSATRLLAYAVVLHVRGGPPLLVG